MYVFNLIQMHTACIYKATHNYVHIRINIKFVYYIVAKCGG